MAVVVTGGAGSLGRAVARILVERDIGVALLDLSSAGVVEAASELQSGTTDGRVVSISCDVAQPSDVASAWQAAEDALGSIEAVINTAGVIRQAPVLELSKEQWDQTIAINLSGPFLVCQRAAQAWVPAGTPGAIVNVASTAAFSATGTVQAIDYGASKAGLLGLTLHLAVHLGQYGIRANCVAPGSFVSNMNAERLKDPDMLKTTLGMIPLRRLGTAEDVAGMCVHLALDATYVTGVVVPVDGGVAARM